MFGQPHNDSSLSAATLQPAAKNDLTGFAPATSDVPASNDYVDAITNAVPAPAQNIPSQEMAVPEAPTDNQAIAQPEFMAQPETAPLPQPEVFTGQPFEQVEPVAEEAPSPEFLLDIKQQALQQLSPLVGQLNQDPEEKFRTTMMMIQASDNSTLIKEAYETALQISDEKVRAQALLDIVNEINYFTHAKDTE